MNPITHHHPPSVHRLARWSLYSFLLTFIAARAVVFLIMSGMIRNMYFFMNGTHVHHLNYGIFLLSVVGGYAVIKRPEHRAADVTAALYGVAMALTFDEFGMWLHLGGSYWQRASVDAVIVVAALLALVSFSRSIRRFESHHFRAFIILLVALAGFGWVLYVGGNHLGEVYGPTLENLEKSSSP